MMVELPKKEMKHRMFKLSQTISGLRKNSSPGQIEVPIRVFDEMEDLIVELFEKIHKLENNNNNGNNGGSA